MGYMVYVRNKKNKAGQPGWWPEKKKLEGLTTYLATGTLAMTSAITGVPIETLRYWKRSPWWKEKIAELQDEDNIELGSKLTKVLEKSLAAVEDRLENGEYMYDPRTGKTKRIPAKLRDVHKVSTDLIDKKQMLLKANKPTGEAEKGKQVTADHLVELAKAFAQFAQGQAPKAEKQVNEIIEGEYQQHFDDLGLETKENAISEERQEGLQAGASLGAQEKTNSG